MNELQLEMERHRKTWRRLEQVTGLLRRIVSNADSEPDGDYLDGTPGHVAVHRIHIENAKATLSQQAEPVEPAPAQDEPLDQRMLEHFTCRRVENAGGTPGFTLYFTKMGSHHEYQLYRNEAAALHANLGSALGITRPAQTEQQPEHLVRAITQAVQLIDLLEMPHDSRIACIRRVLRGGLIVQEEAAPQPEQSAEAFVVGFKPGMSEVTLKVEGGRLPTWMDMGFPVTVLPTQQENE